MTNIWMDLASCVFYLIVLFSMDVPLTLYRDGVTFDVRLNSSDRAKFLKAPKMH